jgi:hypothetical protein
MTEISTRQHHCSFFEEVTTHTLINISLQRSNNTNNPEAPAGPTFCTKDLAKKENYIEALKISVQDADEHLPPPPPSKTPEGKEKESTHQNSEEHPRRHRCFVDLKPHPPRPAGLPPLGNVGRGEPRAHPSRHATGADRQGRWKTSASPARSHTTRVGQASLWILPATSTGDTPIQIPSHPTPEMEKAPAKRERREGNKSPRPSRRRHLNDSAWTHTQAGQIFD